jgi:FkbM family methyltransferase
MKQLIKNNIGRCVIPLGEKLPATKRFLKTLGYHTSEGQFQSRTVSVQFAHGGSFRLTNIDRNYLSFQLFWRGADYYEPITRMVIRELLRPGDTFLDIGANIGFFTVALGTCKPDTKIIAIEPNLKNFSILQENVAVNHLKNVTCESFAISDEDGFATLYLAESDMSASLVQNFKPDDNHTIAAASVQTRSLDSYIEREKITAPILIKVDIEGNEPAFLNGARRTISAWKPDIVMEILGDREPDFADSLRECGYRFYRITDGGLLESGSLTLCRKGPFVFLNYLLSTKPREELGKIFKRILPNVEKLDLYKTSKYFPVREKKPALKVSSLDNSPV